MMIEWFVCLRIAPYANYGAFFLFDLKSICTMSVFTKVKLSDGREANGIDLFNASSASNGNSGAMPYLFTCVINRDKR